MISKFIFIENNNNKYLLKYTLLNKLKELLVSNEFDYTNPLAIVNFVLFFYIVMAIATMYRNIYTSRRIEKYLRALIVVRVIAR